MTEDDFCIVAKWDERGGFFPLRSTLRRCLDAFRHGESLILTIERQRSMASHRHQFAQIRDLWANIHEDDAGQPWAANPETFRKHALIATGYRVVNTIDAGSKAAAERVAAAIPAMHREYCIASVQGPLVIVATAESQSVRAMGAQRFQASKTAVLDWCEARVTGEVAA